MSQSTMIQAKYIPPTNTRGSRIQLKTWDLKHRNGDKPHVRYIGWDYAGVNMVCMACEALGPAFKLLAENERSGVVVLMFKWNIEALAKFFKVELESYEKSVSL